MDGDYYKIVDLYNRELWFYLFFIASDSILWYDVVLCLFIVIVYIHGFRDDWCLGRQMEVIIYWYTE